MQSMRHAARQILGVMHGRNQCQAAAHQALSKRFISARCLGSSPVSGSSSNKSAHPPPSRGRSVHGAIVHTTIRAAAPCHAQQLEEPEPTPRDPHVRCASASTKPMLAWRPLATTSNMLWFPEKMLCSSGET